MSTTTQERPVAPPEVDVIVTSKKGSKKPQKTTKVVVRKKDASLLKKAAKKAKKLAKKAKAWMKRALRWMSKKSRKAYLRGMAWARKAATWTKAKAVAGAGVVATVANSTWVRATTAAAWAWSYTAPVFYWMSTPTRAVVGSLVGLTIWSVFSATTLATIGAGLLIYMLLASTTRTTRVVKVKHDHKHGHKHGHKKGRTAEQIALAERTGPVVVEVNEEFPTLALAQLHMDVERQLAILGNHKSPSKAEVSNLLGQQYLIASRIEGRLDPVKVLFAEYKKALQHDNLPYDGTALSNGMRSADTQVAKIVAEHQSSAITVEA